MSRAAVSTHPCQKTLSSEENCYKGLQMSFVRAPGMGSSFCHAARCVKVVFVSLFVFLFFRLFVFCRSGQLLQTFYPHTGCLYVWHHSCDLKASAFKISFVLKIRLPPPLRHTANSGENLGKYMCSLIYLQQRRMPVEKITQISVQ